MLKFIRSYTYITDLDLNQLHFKFSRSTHQQILDLYGSSINDLLTDITNTVSSTLESNARVPNVSIYSLLRSMANATVECLYEDNILNDGNIWLDITIAEEVIYTILLELYTQLYGLLPKGCPNDFCYRFDVALDKDRFSPRLAEHSGPIPLNIPLIVTLEIYEHE